MISDLSHRITDALSSALNDYSPNDGLRFIRPLVSEGHVSLVVDHLLARLRTDPDPTRRCDLLELLYYLQSAPQSQLGSNPSETRAEMLVPPPPMSEQQLALLLDAAMAEADPVALESFGALLDCLWSEQVFPPSQRVRLKWFCARVMVHGPLSARKRLAAIWAVVQNERPGPA